MHEPTEVGEHLVYDAADFDVTIEITDLSLGLVVAASAPDEGLHYRLEGSRNFVFSASPYFQASSTVAGGVTVTSYYFEGEALGGAAILEQAAKAVTTYSDRFAPYPYASLSIVEAVYPDGMEYSGLFFLSQKFYTSYDGGKLNDLIAIGVHEAAHNWWYGLVGNDQAEEPWLDEAMATYSEYIFYEVNHPNRAASWWGFRVNAFDPSGWVDATIYNGGAFRPYTNAVYLRGARFLNALRGRIGDEAFFAFLRDYAAQMSYRRASSSDFFAILRQHTDVDFSDLIGANFKNLH
jgi:aminopeptidase N